MSIPYQPQNLQAEQADGNILLTWQGSLGATSYQIQRSTDGVNFTNLAVTGLVASYTDRFPGIGIMYYYQVAAVNVSGTSPYSSVAQMVAAPPSEMSLYELRLRSQQTADRVSSDFVSTTEWNAFIRLAMYELYDILMTSYEDYFAQAVAFIQTNGTTANYPLPDGATNYPGGTYDGTTSFTFTLTNPANATIGDIYYQNGTRFTVQSTIVGGTSLTVTGNGTPLPDGILSIAQGNGDSEIVYSSYSEVMTKAPAQAFYKLAGIDLNVNTSRVTPSRVSLLRFDFIKRNQYVYPNSTSTIYGVYNMRYRIMGNKLNIIPTPAGNQTLVLWYSPRLPALLSDTDVTTLGISGWLRYVIVRAAKYALDKEEGTDTTKLDSEILFLKTRIEQAASNRDAGIPDTISETRRDPVYGGTGWGGGNQGGW